MQDEESSLVCVLDMWDDADADASDPVGPLSYHAP